MSSPDISHEELLRLLSYDRDTGEFIWRVNYRKNRIGDIAGHSDCGYRSVILGRKRYRNHRLAWFYITGEWPTAEIDHRDGNRSNNKFSNLRPATRSENAANQGPLPSNKTGFRGVHFHNGAQKYRAQITKDGKVRSLGYFETAEDAARAYAKAARELHGEFARIARELRGEFVSIRHGTPHG